MDNPENNNGNGHQTTNVLENYNPNVMDITEKNSNSRLEQFNLENAMRQSEGFTALKQYIEPGDDIYSLLLRSDIDFSNGDNYRWLVSISVEQTKAIKAGREDQFKREVMLILAGMPAFKGKRMTLLTDAVIGMHRTENQEKDRSLKSKISSMFNNSGNEGNG